MAKIRKIIKGSSIPQQADDAARTSGFSCTANSGETTGTDQNENVFAFTTTGGDTTIDQAQTAAETALTALFNTKIGNTHNVIPARGIVLAGATANKVDDVSFIYLNQNIHPLLSSETTRYEVDNFGRTQHGTKSFTDIGFLSAENIIRSTFSHNDNSRELKPFDIPRFKITKILHSTETHSQKGTSNTSQLKKRINVYSFALKPEEHQPSGTCNFSRIDTAQLITDITIGNTHNIYAVNYNVLRIMSGMGGLAYSN